MITEFRCPKCGGEFTGAESYAADCTCPHCGLRFGFPRVKWDGRKLVALDDIKAGEPVQVLTHEALAIELPSAANFASAFPSA